jgi:uncharacterized membrane protein
MALVRAYEKLRFWMQGNSKRQAKKNISYHYDLGNDFYSLWLDDTMTYSSALFETGQESTEAAQRAKYAALADKIGVKPGDHLLEIGCGWGGFAEYAAKERGARITGLTISRANTSGSCTSQMPSGPGFVPSARKIRPSGRWNSSRPFFSLLTVWKTCAK